MKLLRKLLLTSFLLSLAVLLYAREETVSETFQVQEGMLLNIDTKYGNVFLETWNKDEVTVLVTITVNSSKQEMEDKIFENLKVDVSQSGDKLIAKTEFGNFFSFMKLSNSLFRSGEFKISYKIKAPSYLDVDIKLENGDLVLHEREGNIMLKHSGGYLSAEKLSGNNELDLHNVNAQIQSLGDGRLNLKGSDVNITQKAGKLLGDSYSSTLNIAQVSSLDLKSMKDKITLGEVEYLYFAATISNMEVNKLHSIGVLKTSYGSITLNEISNSFEKIDSNNKMTKVVMVFAKRASYRAEIRHHRSMELDISDSFGFTMKFGESTKDFITSGTVGTSTSPANLFIEGKGGRLQIR